jgi:hypothetical protein
MKLKNTKRSLALLLLLTVMAVGLNQSTTPIQAASVESSPVIEAAAPGKIAFLPFAAAALRGVIASRKAWAPAARHVTYSAGGWRAIFGFRMSPAAADAPANALD